MPRVDGRLIGKYRKLLVDFERLPDEAAFLAVPLQKLRMHFVAGSLTEAEYVTWFILLFAAVRAYGAEYREVRKAHTLALALAWLWGEGEPAVDLRLFLANLQLKGMPAMVFHSLGAWLRGEVRLKLSEKPVSAETMLFAQAAGWRYVTLDIGAALHGAAVNRTRDAFEFALHDIGHAWAFFNPAYDPAGQVAFFAELLADLPWLQLLANNNVAFSAALEYAMADMNSHPQHLRQYLAANLYAANASVLLGHKE